MDVEPIRTFDRAVPGASSLLESLRGVGYSPWTAIADLVDNSIAAKATRVWIEFVWRGAQSYVRIVHDGHGMDQDALVSAMRPGSRSPRDLRPRDDLGRFGLGLKTASLSQCRVLTVATRCPGGESVERYWDLDHVARVDDWQLLIGRPDDVSEEAHLPHDLSSGTVVLWTRLDRLVGDAAESDVDARRRFFETARHVENHLAMTHHRFLEGSSPRLKIFIGSGEGTSVASWDPFMAGHPATIRTPAERLLFAGGHVEVQGFVLPHRDRLTADQLESAAGPEGWLAHQGFFVYRADRLVVFGGWLGLGGARRWARDELHRLARVRVDLANSADDEWKIDIRKSIAIPPAPIRGRLRALAERVRADSREVLAHRGGREPGPVRSRSCEPGQPSNRRPGFRIASIGPIRPLNGCLISQAFRSNESKRCSTSSRPPCRSSASGWTLRSMLTSAQAAGAGTPIRR